MDNGFLGNRAFYKKLAGGLSLYAMGSVYGLFAGVEYIWLNDSSVFQPKALAAVGGAIVAFSFFAYFCFLLLDAQIFAPRDKADKAQDENQLFIPLP
jgi:hypothetical protein